METCVRGYIYKKFGELGANRMCHVEDGIEK